MSVLRLGLLTLLLWVQSDSSKPGMELLGFDLNETPSDVIATFGQPNVVDDSLPNYTSWFFKLGANDEHDYGYIFCFRRSDHKLVSITRNFEPEAVVDHLFPEGGSVIHHWPSEDKPQFGVRVRTLSGERFLLAMGCDVEGKPCGQIILIHRTAVPIFLPWLMIDSHVTKN